MHQIHNSVNSSILEFHKHQFDTEFLKLKFKNGKCDLSCVTSLTSRGRRWPTNGPLVAHQPHFEERWNWF